MTVGQICTRQVVTVGPDEGVLDVARLMRDKHVGDVVVLSGGDIDRPIGIITDRDIVVGILATAPDELDALRVGDVMTTDLVTAPEADIGDDDTETMSRDMQPTYGFATSL